MSSGRSAGNRSDALVVDTGEAPVALRGIALEDGAARDALRLGDARRNRTDCQSRLCGHFCLLKGASVPALTRPDTPYTQPKLPRLDWNRDRVPC